MHAVRKNASRSRGKSHARYTSLINARFPSLQDVMQKVLREEVRKMRRLIGAIMP